MENLRYFGTMKASWVALMRDVIDSYAFDQAGGDANTSGPASKVQTEVNNENINDGGKSLLKLKASQTKQKKSKSVKGRSTLPYDFHKEARPSLLSSGAAHTNYRGFFNLSLIVLFAMNLRLIIENILKYGIIAFDGNVARQSLEVSHLRDKHPGLIETVACALLLNVPALLCLGIERWAAGAENAAPEHLLFVLHAILTSSVLVAPCVVVTYYQTAFFPGSALVFIA